MLSSILVSLVQVWGSGIKKPASHVKFQAIASYHKSETSNTFHSFLWEHNTPTSDGRVMRYFIFRPPDLQMAPFLSYMYRHHTHIVFPLRKQSALRFIVFLFSIFLLLIFPLKRDRHYCQPSILCQPLFFQSLPSILCQPLQVFFVNLS